MNSKINDGRHYGGIDANGVSATEREFDRAVLRRKERLVFHKAGTSAAREEKQKAFVTMADAQVTRRSFRGVPDLQGQLNASLVRILENERLISSRPFDARAARATMNDLDEQRILAVIEQAGKARNFTLRRPASAKEALRHLNLLDGEVPSHAAVILFAPESRRIVSSAFITCLHFAGTQSARPILSQNVVHGPLFDQIDAALDFVMARLARPVGTREESARLERGFEIPRPAVAEAIINAVAHRDYRTRQPRLAEDFWAFGQAIQPLVSGGKNPPINGDGDFFGGVWAFHRRPSALRMPSCSWL